MTKQFRAALLIAVLTLSLLTGCAARGTGQSEPMLTAGEAQAIALEDAGFTADQVTRLHTEPELRDRVPHYDVEFHEGRWDYEYEIHAETGEILSFDKDD